MTDGDARGSNGSSRTVLLVGTIVVVLGVIATVLLQRPSTPNRPTSRRGSPEAARSEGPAVKASTALGVVTYPLARWIFMRIDDNPDLRLTPDQVKRAYAIASKDDAEKHVPELMAILEGKQADAARSMIEQRESLGFEPEGQKGARGFARYLERRQDDDGEQWHTKARKATTNVLVSSLLALYDDPAVKPTTEQTAALLALDKNQALRSCQRAWSEMPALLDKTLTEAQKAYLKEHPASTAEPVSDKDVVTYLAGVAKVSADSAAEAPVPGSPGATGARKKAWPQLLGVLSMNKTPNAITADQAKALLPLMKLCARLSAAQRDVEKGIWGVLNDDQRKALLDGLEKPETTTVEEFQTRLESHAKG